MARKEVFVYGLKFGAMHIIERYGSSKKSVHWIKKKGCRGWKRRKETDRRVQCDMSPGLHSIGTIKKNNNNERTKERERYAVLLLFCVPLTLTPMPFRTVAALRCMQFHIHKCLCVHIDCRSARNQHAYRGV